MSMYVDEKGKDVYSNIMADPLKQTNMLQQNYFQMMGPLTNKYFRKPWGNHKNGWWVLIYNHGTEAELRRVHNGTSNYKRIVTIPNADIEKWTKEHEFERFLPEMKEGAHWNETDKTNR